LKPSRCGAKSNSKTQASLLQSSRPLS